MDGVRYNLQFNAYQDALPAWRFPDLTDHVEYLPQIVRITNEQEMRKEPGYLRSLRAARERVKQVIEEPDSDIDRIIRSVRENSGQLSEELLKDFPLLAKAPVSQQVVAASEAVFSGPS